MNRHIHGESGDTCHLWDVNSLVIATNFGDYMNNTCREPKHAELGRNWAIRRGNAILYSTFLIAGKPASVLYVQCSTTIS